jgi:hypothetical protein
MGEKVLAVQEGVDGVALDDDFELVPGLRRGRDVPNPLHGAAFAFLEFPKHQIVFEWVGPHGQIVAIGLQIEEDARTLVDAARDALEPQGDRALTKIIDARGNGVGEVVKRFYVVQKFAVALAVEGLCPLGQAGCRLSLVPFAPVNDEHLVVVFAADGEIAHNGEKRFGLAAYRLVFEIEFDFRGLLSLGARREIACQRQCSKGDCKKRFSHVTSLHEKGDGCGCANGLLAKREKAKLSLVAAPVPNRRR